MPHAFPFNFVGKYGKRVLLFLQEFGERVLLFPSTLVARLSFELLGDSLDIKIRR